MKKFLLITLIIVGAIACATQSQAVILYAIADAPTYTGYPNTNFDNYYHSYYSDLDRELWTGNFWGCWNTRTYLRFDLSGTSTVVSAMLRLYNGVGPGGKGSSYAPASVSAYSTSINWAEQGITWNNQPALCTLGDTITVGSGVGWYSWNVTSIAQPSAGGTLSVALASNGAGHVYYARETLSGFDPYLEVVVPEPSTIISFSSFILLLLEIAGFRRKFA